MLYITGLVVVAAIITVAVLAYVTIWQVAIYSTLSCASTGLGTVLASVTLLVWLRTRTKESRALSRVRKGLFLGSLFLLLQVAYLPITRGLRDLEVRRAKDFVTALIPRLEEHWRAYDRYPASVDAVLTGDEGVPRLLQLSGGFYDNRQYYVQREATYGFRFYLPDGFIGFQYEYCCGADGVWTVTD
jgi:hypothetical protein